MLRRVRHIILLMILCLLLTHFSAVAADEEKRFLPIIYSSFPANDPLDEGRISFEELEINELEENMADRWTMDFSAGDEITITVAAENSADIILSIYEGGTLIHTQNLSPAGEVETISDLPISKTGQYELLIQSVHGQPTGYALMLMDQNSFNFVFRDVLQDDDSRKDSLPADVDHFWFFTVEEGQTISFTISPISLSDVYIELYDSGSVRLLTIDEGGIGEVEELENLQAFRGGFYAIRVGEFDFQPMDYQISLTIQ